MTKISLFVLSDFVLFGSTAWLRSTKQLSTACKWHPQYLKWLYNLQLSDLSGCYLYAHDLIKVWYLEMRHHDVCYNLAAAGLLFVIACYFRIASRTDHYKMLIFLLLFIALVRKFSQKLPSSRTQKFRGLFNVAKRFDVHLTQICRGIFKGEVWR